MCVYLLRVGDFYQIKIVIIQDKVRHIDLDKNARITLINFINIDSKPKLTKVI